MRLHNVTILESFTQPESLPVAVWPITKVSSCTYYTKNMVFGGRLTSTDWRTVIPHSITLTVENFRSNQIISIVTCVGSSVPNGGPSETHHTIGRIGKSRTSGCR